jgi:hypothetical protein
MGGWAKSCRWVDTCQVVFGHCWGIRRAFKGVLEGGGYSFNHAFAMPAAISMNAQQYVGL